MRSLTPDDRGPRREPILSRIAQRDQGAKPRDPAPSRWSYRFERLWLTPMFRRVLRFGIPLTLTCAATTLWFSDADRRDAFVDGIAEIRRSVEERPEFMVKLMAVDGASDAVSADIREVLSLDFPISSFHLDLEELRARVETLDAVAKANLHIRPGGVLQLDIRQRVPAVVWRTPQGLTLLDNDGQRVAAVGTRSDRADLPLLVGTGAQQAVPEALALLSSAGPVAANIRGLLRVGERRWDAVLTSGARIMLPETDPVPAMERVVALDQTQELLARDIAVVDLRNTERPTIRLTVHSVEQLSSIRNISQRD